MKIRTITMILLGIAVTACVGADDTNNPDSGVDADPTGTKDHACYNNGSCNSGLSCVSNVCVDLSSLDGGLTDVSTTDGAIADAGGDANCKPVTNPVSMAAGPFCPFETAADGGVYTGICGTGQHCCVYPLIDDLPSTCNSANAACSPDVGAVDFQCQETNDCPSPQICCLNQPALLFAQSGCSYDYVSKSAGTSCTTTCSPFEPQLCGSNADCSGGKSCVPTSTYTLWLGVCQAADGGI